MTKRKVVAIGLALATITFVLPPEARANDEEDARFYGALEARNPELGEFQGGCGPNLSIIVIIILTLPISAPFAGIYLLVEWMRMPGAPSHSEP